MEDVDSAAGMVSYFTGCSAVLRDRYVHVQFSKHKELKTDTTNSNARASAQAALQAAQVLTKVPDSDKERADGIVQSSETSGAGGGPNTILLVVIENLVYPVTLDVIHQIFSKFGNVLKIITFTKNNTFQVGAL